jgi:hypothetical protein
MSKTPRAFLAEGKEGSDFKIHAQFGSPVQIFRQPASAPRFSPNDVLEFDCQKQPNSAEY